MKTKIFIASVFSILATVPLNAQWFKQYVSTPNPFSSIHCINDSTCYAVGTEFTVFKTIDGGVNWKIAGGSPGYEDKLVVKMLNKDTVLIGLDNGSFKKTVTGSTTNTWLSPDPFSGNNQIGIYDIAYVSKTNFTAVGGSVSNLSSGGNITTSSTNTGATWTPASVISGGPTIFGIHAITSNTFVACTGGGTIIKSTDAGVSWVIKKNVTPNPPAFYDINFPTPTVGYVVGGSSTTVTATGAVVYKTTDGGETWTIPSNTGLLPNTLYGVNFVSKDSGYVVGNGGKIQVTTDGGQNWTTQISPVTTTLNKIYFPSKKVGYIAGVNGVILKTTDGGFISPLVVTGNNVSVCTGLCATIGGSGIASGGTPPYTYSWSQGGNTNSSIVVCPTVKTTYTVAVTDVNNLKSTGTFTVSIYPVTSVSFSGLPATYCLNGTKASLVGSPAGGTFSGSVVSGNLFDPKTSGSGTHTVTYIYTDPHTCINSSTQSVTVSSIPSAGSLCLVTVDSITSDKNIIVWDKPAVGYIANFKIYRIVGATMVNIGSVPYSAPSKFIDNTTGVDPKTQQHEYAVSIVDTCGLESDLSIPHRPIWLLKPLFSQLTTFDLEWYGYVGLPVTNYEIWRKDNASANWAKIATVPKNTTNYTDNASPLPNSSRYRIQAVYPAGCMIDANTTLNSIKSNISDDFTGISEISLDNLLSVYPNPNRGSFLFNISGAKYQTLNIKVYSMWGERIYETTLKNQKSEITIPGIAPGIYQLQVITDKGIANKKITIQ